MAYADLVTRIAQDLYRSAPDSLELADLVQAGMEGLMQARDRFRDDHGTRFESFAGSRIRGAMIDEIRRSSSVPSTLYRAIRSVDRATQRLEQRLGRRARDQEVAVELGTTPAALRKRRSQQRPFYRLLHEDGGDTNPAELFSEEPQPERSVDRSRSHGLLEQALIEHDEIERLVIAYYDLREFSLREVGDMLGLTESRISQLRKQAIGHLRERLVVEATAPPGPSDQ